jgi:Mg2+/Co2+ transporter CorC
MKIEPIDFDKTAVDQIHIKSFTVIKKINEIIAAHNTQQDDDGVKGLVEALENLLVCVDGKAVAGSIYDVAIKDAKKALQNFKVGGR